LAGAGGRSGGEIDSWWSWWLARQIAVSLIRAGPEGTPAILTAAPPASFLDRLQKSGQTRGVRPTLDAEPLLRGAALRVTRPRVAVLTAVHEHPHLDTESIIGVVRADLGEVSAQAVYDVLRALTAAGLVRRIEPAGSAARYESRVGDNHHHVMCRSCGEIADVDCAVGDTPCLTASDDHGYAIDEAEVVYWGRCPACSAQAASRSAD
jgi:Fur family ferric uptake transcriptional regulator